MAFSAANNPTLLDIAIANGVDAAVGLIDEASQPHPEITGGFARTISKTQYKTLVRLSNPTVSFRHANEGVAGTKGRYENRLVETFILNPRWECDKAVADAYEDGAEAYIAMEGSSMMEAALQHLCSQMYYGTDTDSKGFPGLAAAIDSAMEVDATGTGSACTSVWAVRWGIKEVSWVWGLDGSLDLSDVTEERVLDSDSNPFTAYCQELLAYAGLQVASIYSIGRVKNISASATLNDTKLAQLINKFPAGRKPDVFYMNGDALEQLRASRTATNATGAPAPIPDQAFGIPIQETDAITFTETAS